jgi:hypothetical protein
MHGRDYKIVHDIICKPEVKIPSWHILGLFGRENNIKINLIGIVKSLNYLKIGKNKMSGSIKDERFF